MDTGRKSWAFVMQWTEQMWTRAGAVGLLLGNGLSKFNQVGRGGRM